MSQGEQNRFFSQACPENVKKNNPVIVLVISGGRCRLGPDFHDMSPVPVTVLLYGFEYSAQVICTIIMVLVNPF